MDENLKEVIGDRKIILLMKFGSHLYGTNTPESDIDYKGVYMPTKEEIFLNKIPKCIQFSSGDPNAKNTKEDVDIELYSLHYFLELAFKGETVAIDMLHCNKESCMDYTQVWTFIHKHRNLFYTNNLKGFVEYCRKQAAKYGIKGSRIADARTVSTFLGNQIWGYGGMRSMDYVWDKLPKGDHIHFVTGGKKDSTEVFYQVCGKRLQRTARMSYCKDILDKFIESYGHRAKEAEKNKGIDWKAVSHAIRHALQIRDIFTDGDIIFPLKGADFLRSVKLGKFDYLTAVAPVLESLMDDIEILSKTTNLPSKVNQKFWNNWLMMVMAEEIEKATICGACNGRGFFLDPDDFANTCEYCHGSGKKR